MDDDAGAEKADAGKDTLNDAAGGVGRFRDISKGGRQHHDGRGREPHQPKGSQSDRFAMQIAIEADQPARKVAAPRRNTISDQSSKAMLP